MAKQTGLGDGLVVDGIDLSGDTGSLQAIGASRPTTGVTGIDKFGRERKHLIRNGRIDWSAWFNPDDAHPELSPLPTGDRIVTYLRGRGLGNHTANMVAKQLNYDPTRATDGALTIDVQSRSNGYGLEWGQQLTNGLQTFTAAGNGSGVDFGAATNFGLQAYLHVLALDGDDVTVTLQDSANGSDFAAIGSGVAFPEMTAVGSARIQTDRDETIRRHLRIVVSGDVGSGDDVTLLVAVKKNLHEVPL